jgi:P27 family predicted phage terminase small subunit
MRGRKPQPAAIKSQKSAVRSKQPRKPGVRAAAAAESTIVVAGQPPKWLVKEGLKIWQRLAPTLIGAKLLSELDTLTFARYCRNYARWLDALRTIDKEGETYESESQWGKLKRINPVFAIADRLERQLLAAEDRFGLNPAERQRIFAARAQGATGDLFGKPQQPEAQRRPDDAAAEPAAPAAPVDDEPIGLLN